ncbi:MAG: 4Fe-4S binding protein [Clostridia bacterium]|nr:4Fe-4S binding protein [Clostridia bacterium]
MAYKINENCVKCGSCAASCPVSCISEGDERFVIDPEQCIECGTCAAICPVSAPELD